MKKQRSHSNHPEIREPYFTITRDNADGTYRIDIIEATSVEEAQSLAVKARNVQNDYGPREDGGFEFVFALNQDDIRQLLDKLRTHGNRRAS
jgi:hypothetical protein